jgi:hypothetical protein
VETHGPNGEYERAYRQWVASLTPAEWEELKRNGLHKPLRDACMGTLDYSSVLNRAHNAQPGDEEIHHLQMDQWHYANRGNEEQMSTERVSGSFHELMRRRCQ